MKTQRIFFQEYEPIAFSFKQNRYDFIVDEIPSIEFSGKGNYRILKIKKQFTSTWELLARISQELDIPEHLIGYAGLKDKNATTTQYISIPANKSRDYKRINSKLIQVEKTYYHNEKLKIGDLVGNRFIITLKDVIPQMLPKLYQTLSQIQKHGMPNYFGYQRFGFEYNFEQTKQIVYGEEVLSDKKIEKFLKLAYQSYFFNDWLAHRVKLSKKEGLKKLKPLDGDIYSRENRKIITGLVPGRNIIRAKDKAREIEEKYDDTYIHEKGYRRDAMVIPWDITNSYDEKNGWLEIGFTLPKGSYATVLIENLANKNFA
jgi:tRNA pseudouridine13 synthase